MAENLSRSISILRRSTQPVLFLSRRVDFRLEFAHYKKESSALNQQLIEKVFASGRQFSLAITGGGTSAISSLFGVAGASSTLLEATVPYHPIALNRFVSATRSQGCNNRTARAMAMAAFMRAREINPAGDVIGIGCTAAISTNRVRKGSDRCHIAVQATGFTTTYDLELDKRDSRETQELVCRDAIITAMANAAGIATDSSNATVIKNHLMAPEPWQQLLNGIINTSSPNHHRCIFAGAFNPMHEGHRGMIRVAREITGEDVTLELSIRNVDKPPLDYLTMSERVTDTDDFDLVFTNAPTFVEKAAIFPGCCFMVGLDTIIRIDDPKYYTDEAGRDAALVTMAGHEIRFLVFGRKHGSHYQTLGDVRLSPQLRHLCTEVTEQQFREDVSSSEIRAQ